MERFTIIYYRINGSMGEYEIRDNGVIIGICRTKTTARRMVARLNDGTMDPPDHVARWE